MLPLPPPPTPQAGRAALAGLVREKSIVGALRAVRDAMGNVFTLPLPGFAPIFVSGAQAIRFVLVTERAHLNWRSEGDPVTELFHHGLLVQDGAAHDSLRRVMDDSLHRQMVAQYVSGMVENTDEVMKRWTDARPRDMAVEMRRIALLIFMQSLCGVDFRADLDMLWQPILKAIAYISPGAWLVWRNVPRFGFTKPLRVLDDYLYRLIRARRATPNAGMDMLSHLIAAGLDDQTIRDQLLTMLIAGHDTSTALLSWTLYLLGMHPDAMQRARAEIDSVLGKQPPSAETAAQLPYLKQVINETLRLYPPIHVGSRVVADDLELEGHRLPRGSRLMYSIYLTHRDPHAWRNPSTFNPDRFATGASEAHTPYTFLPFGGGPRNCIGAAFAQTEAQVVLARILQRFDLELTGRSVRVKMGATLEPRPGVMMRATPRP